MDALGTAVILSLLSDLIEAGTAVLCYKSDGRWFDPSWCHWNFSDRTMALGSTQHLTEYQEVFPGGNGGRCVRLTTLPPFCAVVMKSGNLNFLELSGQLQACKGTALPLP